MKTQKEEYLVVDVYDLEKEIEDRYEIDIELLAAEEWRSDSQHVFWDIDGKLDEWDAKKLDGILSGEISRFGTARRFLNLLVKDGHIEPGNYLVTVCW